MPGVFNVVGDGVIPWTEVVALCGKRTIPLPPFGTALSDRARSPASAWTIPA